MEKYTLDEMLFAIGTFPNANVTEKFSLFLSLMTTSFPDEIKDQSYYNADKMEKLSSNKKASFVSYLETTDIKEEMTRYQKNQIKWLHIFSPEYPEQLKQIYIPPVVLFYKGNIELLKKDTLLGVVGSRAYTEYGAKAVETILTDLISQTKGEIGIVSGLAQGVDTEAHVMTIKNNGQTIGVIGTGLDVFYPSKNKMLQELMGEKHLVLSEYPMGAQPLKFHFPERNRVIAGLSRGILVIEAKKSSGSLITAYNAIEEGRDVFAIPGSIFELNREGNHRLIKLGAILTDSSEDILNEWSYI